MNQIVPGACSQSDWRPLRLRLGRVVGVCGYLGVMSLCINFVNRDRCDRTLTMAMKVLICLCDARWLALVCFPCSAAYLYFSDVSQRTYEIMSELDHLQFAFIEDAVGGGTLLLETKRHPSVQEDMRLCP